MWCAVPYGGGLTPLATADPILGSAWQGCLGMAAVPTELRRESEAERIMSVDTARVQGDVLNYRGAMPCSPVHCAKRLPGAVRPR